MVSACHFQIGDSCVVDPGAEEEAVSGGGVLVSYARGAVTSVLKISGGSLHPATLRDMIQVRNDFINFEALQYFNYNLK